MAHSAPQPDAPYVVTPPRASDAIGCALRDVYARQPLPQDMTVLLGRLNDNNPTRG